MTTPHPDPLPLHAAPRTPQAQRALVTLALRTQHRVVCLDEQGRIIWANPAFSHVCGVPHAAVLGQDWLKLSQPLEDGETPAADDPLHRLLQGRQAFFLPQLQLLGGLQRRVRLEAYPTEPGSDGATGWVVLELPCESVTGAVECPSATTSASWVAAAEQGFTPAAGAAACASTAAVSTPATPAAPASLVARSSGSATWPNTESATPTPMASSVVGVVAPAAGANHWPAHTAAAASTSTRGAPAALRPNKPEDIERALGDALDRGELALRYQPVVALNSGQLTGAEALLRWTHPEWGQVTPAEFLPVANQAGHIHQLGEWVLNEACRQWRRWQNEKPLRAPALLSVNLSRAQWQTGARLVRLVEQTLARHHMPAQALQLEFSERDIVQEPPPLAAVLAPLRELGVHLAVDDYGTAASSLTRLRDLPFDTIKVDRSFVGRLYRDPQAMSLAHATFSVIAARGMISVAEGVEKHSDVAALQAFGCRFGQGHLFGRPVAGDRLLALSHGGPSDHTRGLATAG